MSTTTDVTQKDLHDLLEIFEKKSFEAGSCEEGTQVDGISDDTKMESQRDIHQRASDDLADAGLTQIHLSFHLTSIYDHSITAEHEITKKCEFLFKQDYNIIELDNTNGILSPRYPGRLFIPEYEHGHMATTITANNTNTSSQNSTNATVTPQSSSGSLNGHHHNSTSSNGSASSTVTANCNLHSFVNFANPSQNTNATNSHPYVQTQLQYPQQMTTAPPLPPGTAATTANVGCGAGLQHTIYEDLYDVNKVRELVTMAKYARCRQRFAVPVIMYRGKYICRSATISVMPETYGRKVVDYAYDCFAGTNYSDRGNHTVDDENNDNNDDSLMNHALIESSQFSYDEVIKSDIQLLNVLNVTTIVDLMVEKRKIKYFMAVSSSEKADPEKHYDDFNILSLPYPGCEFFKKFRDNNYMAKNLHYNWNQSFNDANISVPPTGPTTELNVAWNDYKQWDLVLITQNYLKACLKYIQEEASGLLIHCISGWDRTPLFISLVRLSLWADGLIHQNLNAMQMSYFTLAYDWYLFGHQLPDRLKRSEDIMFFCFHVLKYITDAEFSIVEHRRRTKTSSSSGSSSSVIVLKSDCCDEEPVKEDLILSTDLDSNDSFSNSSNCDMSITDNFFATAPATTSATAQPQQTASCTNTGTNPLTSRSPNPKRSKTSPISVPGVSATRQRLESISSHGSWQVVTDTGSIDSMMNSSYRTQQPQNDGNAGGNYVMVNGSTENGCNGSNTPSNASSTSQGNNVVNNGALNNVTNAIYDKDMLSAIKVTALMRKKRLNAVRAIFIQAYGKTVGLKFKEGSAMNLATFIGSLADQLF